MAMRDRDEFELNQAREIGSFFKQLRFKRNKSQKEEAEEIGCSQATLSYFEIGRDDYRFSLLQKMAEHYGYRLEVSLVPIDESIDTRIVAKPDPGFDVPSNGVRDTKYVRGTGRLKSKEPKIKPTIVVYEDEDTFDTQAELAAMRSRLGIAS